MNDTSKTFITCCRRLSDLIKCAGERGLSVIPVRSGERRWFALQMRTVNVGVESRLPTITDGPVMRVSEQVALQFCLFCGADLRRLPAGQRDAFDARAEVLRHLDLGGTQR